MANDVLAGGRGEPILLIRDQPDARALARQQLQREAEDRQMKTILARAEARRFQRPAPYWELKARLEAVNARRQAHADEAVRQEQALADLTEWAVTASLEEASRTPEPIPTRWGRPLSKAQLALEEAQAREAIASWRS